MPSESEWVVETSPEKFEADVIERSQQVPVVLDFWAPWCAPCRTLGPVLEKLAAEGEGQFVLIKANIDECGDFAGQFGVSSVPTVVGLRDGQPVDAFVGALPEAQIKAWLERMLPSAAELATSAALALVDSEPEKAEALLREAWANAAATEVQAPIALARLLLQQNRPDESREILAQLEKRGYLEPEAEQLRAQLDVKEKAADAGSVDDIRAELAKSPGDYSIQLRLAEALAATGEFREALEICLNLVIEDRARTGETARQLMIDLFQLPNIDVELAAEFQRKLSSALY